MAGETFCDNDTSASRKRGKKLKPRNDFERLLARMATGKCQAVLVGDPDRLVREPIDGERFIDVADENKILLAYPSGDYDLSTDGGRLMFRLKVVLAKAEMERKSARQIRANQQHRANGRWGGINKGTRPGHRPFGYTNEGKPHEPEASMLKKAATAVLAKHSMFSIVTEWNNAGVTTSRGCKWTNLQLRRVLANPLYAGLVTHDGKVVGRAAAVEGAVGSRCWTRTSTWGWWRCCPTRCASAPAHLKPSIRGRGCSGVASARARCMRAIRTERKGAAG